MGLNGFKRLKFLYAIFRHVLIVSCIAACLIITWIFLILFIPESTPSGNCYDPPTGCQ